MVKTFTLALTGIIFSTTLGVFAATSTVHTSSADHFEVAALR